MAEQYLPADQTPLEAMTIAAQTALEANNLALAEAICHEAFAYRGSHAPVLCLLAQIYGRLGLWRQAIFAAEQACLRSPADTGMTDCLAKLRDAQAQAPESPAKDQRFLVIKAWGHGLFSDIAHVLGCCLLAEITGRVPVTDWSAGSLYGDGSGRDAFQLFFEPLSPYTTDQVAELTAGSIFPPPDAEGALRRPGGLYFLNRPETTVCCELYVPVAELVPHIPVSHPLAAQSPEELYRYLIRRYLRARPEILAQANAFFGEHLAGRPSAALHLRGSDKRVECDVDPFNDAILDAAEALSNNSRIFVMSDDERLIDACSARFGDRAIFTTCRRTSADVGLHFQGFDGVALGREMLNDFYIALQCDQFFGLGWSNVAAMAEVAKAWPANTCRLASRNVLYERVPMLHRLRKGTQRA